MSGVVSLTVSLDASAFETRLKHLERGMPAALAHALNSVTREAKRQFIGETIHDALGNRLMTGDTSSAESKIRNHVKLSGATPGRLSAMQIIRPPGGDYGVLPAIKAAIRGNQHKPGSVTTSTFTRTGGGSANLVLRHGFVVEANGGKVVLVREKFGPGVGRKLGSGVTKKIYAETVSAAFKQEKAKPRQKWIITVDRRLGVSLSTEVQNLLDGGTGKTLPLGAED